MLNTIQCSIHDIPEFSQLFKKRLRPYSDMLIYRANTSSRFSSDSEELSENREELWYYYMHSDVFSMLILLTTQWCVIHYKRETSLLDDLI